MTYSPDSSRITTPTPLNRLDRFHLYKAYYELARARQDGNAQRAFQLLLALAATYTQHGLFPQAIEIFEQALAMATLAANRRQEGELICTLAGLHYASGQRDRALEQFRRALVIAEEIHDPVLKRASLDGLRQTKTAIVVETLQRHPLPPLPDQGAPGAVPDVTTYLVARILLVLGLFAISFFALPVLLSQLGVSDGVVAFTVIMAGVASAAVFRYFAAHWPVHLGR